jgi:hypothetical protein
MTDILALEAARTTALWSYLDVRRRQSAEGESSSDFDALAFAAAREFDEADAALARARWHSMQAA